MDTSTTRPKNLSLNVNISRMLDALAATDHRSSSAEVSWLVECEYARRKPGAVNGVSGPVRGRTPKRQKAGRTP